MSAALTIAPAYRQVDALSGTVASLRCECAALEAERDDLAHQLVSEHERNAELTAQVERLRAELAGLRWAVEP